MKHFGTLLLLLLILASSCGEESNKKKSYKPESLGAINQLAVVMEDPLWESEVGDKVREYFAAPIVGLPWEEPIFSIEQMPQRVFTGTTRHRRAVLFVGIDSVNVAHVKTDLYARPQKVAVIKGRNRQEIIQNLEAEAESIVAEIRQMELEEMQARFFRSLSKDKVLQEEFGISLNLPSLYKLGKREDGFVWMDREIQKGTMNILAYEMPSDSFQNDTTLIGDIVKMRDSIGQQFIPGPDLPTKKTYMVTENAFAPYVFSTEIAGREALEVRGIWEVHNYPMAGPFLTYIIRDEENNRNLVLEGFTFAPSTNKRDYMFELEAILKTSKIP
jgi:hypothetical protein